MEDLKQDEEELKERIKLAESRYGPWHKYEDVISQARKMGKEEIVKKYATPARKIYENSPIYFTLAGTCRAELKIVPDDWQLDGCDSLPLSTVQKNYIRFLIDEKQTTKAQGLLEKILQNPNTNKFDIKDFKNLLEQTKISR